jgi:hypothetical protein
MSTVPEAERTQPFHTFTRARTNLAPEQARHLGRIRWGSAFFGWVTAIGTTALLGAIVTAGGAALGLVNPLTAAPGPAPTMGVAGAVLMLVAIFVGYCCGGYVAGRMARFAGARQGVAVWLWTLFLAVIGAVIATVSGVVSGPRLDELIRLPMSGGVLSAGAATLAVAVLVVTLVGAVLGGLAGMRYHRKVDRDLVVPSA